MEKRQNPFMTKIEGNFLNLIKGIYEKFTTNLYGMSILGKFIEKESRPVVT